MNIFATSECPIISAYNLPHSHTVKMILESAQMLSSAHRIIDNTDNDLLYKTTHQNHPSSVWVRACKDNYTWLYEHMMALGDVYTARTGKVHKTIEKLSELLSEAPRGIPDSTFVYKGLPTPAMPEEYANMNTSTDVKYQHYLNAKYKMWISTGNSSCKNLIWTVDYPEWLDREIVEYSDKLVGGI